MGVRTGPGRNRRERKNERETEARRELVRRVSAEASGGFTGRRGLSLSGIGLAAYTGTMNVGIYKGASAMLAYERWQEAISQNLASASVDGYRRNETSLQAFQEDLTKLMGEGGDVRKSLKGVVPEVKQVLNNTQGAFTHTGVETNFGIEGEGFFRIRKPDGTVGYTRNGNFRMSGDRTLVNQQGFTVDGDNGAITFRQEGGKILLNPQGVLVQGTQQLTKLSVYRFDRPNEMQRIGDGLLTPAQGDAARPVDGSPIVQGVLEASNVVPLNEMVSLVSVSRAYETARKIVEVQDDTVGKTIQSLGAPVS